MKLDDLKDQSSGHCICTNEGRVVYQNRYCMDHCGHRSGKICQDGCREFLPPDSRENFLLKSKRDIFNKKHNVIMHKHDEFQSIHLFPLLEEQAMINFDVLTKKEREIALLMSKGFSNLEIVEKLRIAKTTLKTHINHIYQKLEKEVFQFRNNKF